jgi:hypothetical protein
MQVRIHSNKRGAISFEAFCANEFAPAIPRLLAAGLFIFQSRAIEVRGISAGINNRLQT